jgi:hypothetical protein
LKAYKELKWAIEVVADHVGKDVKEVERVIAAHEAGTCKGS